MSLFVPRSRPLPPTNAQIQADAAWALHQYLGSEIILTAMDLSVEAELFGCRIRFEEQKIPTVIGRRAATIADIEALPKPSICNGRAPVNLLAAETLAKKAGSTPVLGGLIGPFSLAGRIFGVSEALEATALQPELIHAILERVTSFYIRHFTHMLEAADGQVDLAFNNSERIATVQTKGMRALVDGVMARWFTADTIALAPEQWMPIRERFLTIDPRGYAACCAAIRDMDLRGIIGGRGGCDPPSNGIE